MLNHSAENPSWPQIFARSWRGATRGERAAFVYFGLICSVSVATTLLKPAHAHFWIWVGAAENLAQGRQLSPVVTEYTEFFRAWLYPPSTALFFYPFVGMSKGLGQAIYLGGSLILTLAGAFQLLRGIRGENLLRGMAIFFLIFASDVVSAIPVIRVELLSLGVCFWVAYWIGIQRRFLPAGLALGFIASLKLQLVPTVGLLALVLLHLDLRSAARYLIGAVVGAAILPLIFAIAFDSAYVAEAYRIWSLNLQVGTERTWSSYQNLFAFFHANFGVPTSSRMVSGISALLGLGFAAYVWDRVRRCPFAVFARPQVCTQAVLLALGLGGMFTVLFSPMSQGSGYLLATPLVLLVVWLRSEEPSSRSRAIWTAALLGYWLVSYVVFSDAVPKSLERFCQAIHVRPVGALLLTLTVLVRFRCGERHGTLDR